VVINKVITEGYVVLISLGLLHGSAERDN